MLLFIATVPWWGLILSRGAQVQGLIGQTAIQTTPEAEFQLELEKDGVKVYVRTEAGDAITVRVDAVAASTPERVKTVLDNAPGYPDWVHRCAEAYVLPGGSTDDYVYFSLVDMPFPFSDKEVVARIHQRWNADRTTLTRTIVAEPSAIPPHDGRHRLESYDAEWTITREANGYVSISCVCTTTAGSGLPNWLRKDILTGGPAKTMRNLVGLLEK